MANWGNVRLSVFGIPAELKPFRKAAGALQGRIDATKSSIFSEGVEIGEGGDLEAWGESPFQRRFRRAEYVFQGRKVFRELMRVASVKWDAKVLEFLQRPASPRPPQTTPKRRPRR